LEGQDTGNQPLLDRGKAFESRFFRDSLIVGYLAAVAYLA
jgi:hypothetical protein